jgi:hypothetical protein
LSGEAESRAHRAGIKQIKSERKTLEAAAKSTPRGFTATVDQIADCQAKV